MVFLVDILNTSTTKKIIFLIFNCSLQNNVFLNQDFLINFIDKNLG